MNYNHGKIDFNDLSVALYDTSFYLKISVEDPIDKIELQVQYDKSDEKKRKRLRYSCLWFTKEWKPYGHLHPKKCLPIELTRVIASFL
jgi:hypothetical protein